MIGALPDGWTPTEATGVSADGTVVVGNGIGPNKTAWCFVWDANKGTLRLAEFEEGLCMQILHIGPYAAEPATVERMRAFALENGYEDCVGLGGRHHEIYLGDPRKADPSKLKTVLRHPVQKAR